MARQRMSVRVSCLYVSDRVLKALKLEGRTISSSFADIFCMSYWLYLSFYVKYMVDVLLRLIDRAVDLESAHVSELSETQTLSKSAFLNDRYATEVMKGSPPCTL